MHLRIDAMERAGRLNQSEADWFRSKLDFLAEAIDAHCIVGPSRPSDFAACCFPVEIEKTIRRYACQALETEHDGVCPPDYSGIVTFDVRTERDLRIREEYFGICLYNLLKNAGKHGNGAEIYVCADDKEEAGWLTTHVTNVCSNSDLERIKAAFDEDLLADPPIQSVIDKECQGFSEESRGNGIVLAKRLARWHRVPEHPEGGNLSYKLITDNADRTCVRVTLKLPITSYSYSGSGTMSASA